MIPSSAERKGRFTILAILTLLLAAGPPLLFAKGFSGRGGFRGGSHSSGGFRIPSRPGGKSFSFSGSSGRRSSASIPSYDRAAGLARRHEISLGRFTSWRGSEGRHEIPSFNPSLQESRPQRMANELGWRQPSGYYHEQPNVIIYRDGYDNGFMKYATLMWLFNHWNNIDHSRFDDARVRDLEARFSDLEAKGYKRDPNYSEPGVDPDLAYRKDVAYGNHGSRVWLFWTTVGGAVLVWGIWYVFVRRIPYTKT